MIWKDFWHKRSYSGIITFSCSANRSRCTTGSFNSVYALHTWTITCWQQLL